MNAVVVLDWDFSPPNYFEDALDVSRQNYTMTIADGKVQANIDSAIYQANISMRQSLHNAPNDRFLDMQLLTHRAYELSRSTMTRMHPDDHRDIFVCVIASGSYDAAVRDPNNELVHLYEVREALSVRFDGEHGARSALGIGSSRWPRSGQLCNNEPLRQGWHRGKTGGVRRDATEGELTEARGITRCLIEAYFQHVDASTGP